MADARKAAWITIPGEVCRDFEKSSRLEWLDTNHTGAFAMGTVAGVNTRRYHGLLIASLNPPSDRYSILPRAEERLTIDGQTFELATVQYPGTVRPRGFEHLQEFSLSPFPRWRYQAGGIEIVKTVCLIDKQPAVLVRYEATGACRLDVRLLLSFRDYHSLTHENSLINTRVATQLDRVLFGPYPDLPALALLHNGTFETNGVWFLNHEYLREMERGLDYREDLFSPGSISFELNPQQPSWFLAALDGSEFATGPAHPDILSILHAEERRREFSAIDPTDHTLRRALDQFRIMRSDGNPSLIAGYPWFTDWSRDTLISLPGLWKAGFGFDESRQILTTLAGFRSQGILPNRFGDKQSVPEYNTVDASLWFFVAAHEFIESTKDSDFLRATLYPAALDIIEWHMRGTLYDIRADPADHLLSAGSPETQLTWMDAKVGGIPVTPRNGKPVEINALWYNALRIVAHWSKVLGRSQEYIKFRRECTDMLASFRQSFWNPRRACLYDVITPLGPDAAVRPNQIFALSLPFPLFDGGRARSIAAIVREELLTPVGLRTLAPSSPHYCPHFEGGMAERDAAYHQGTVWPWLIGPFIRAYLYAHGQSEESVSFCRDLLGGLEECLSTLCLGSLAEVFDGDPPHRPAGCFAQLWSVAQFLIARDEITRCGRR